MENYSNRSTQASKPHALCEHKDKRIFDHWVFEYSNLVCSAGLRMGEIRQFCKLPEDDAQSLIRAAMSQLNLSARAYHRTRSVKLARTIADTAGCEGIQLVHLAEALQYRPKLMMS